MHLKTRYRKQSNLLAREEQVEKVNSSLNQKALEANISDEVKIKSIAILQNVETNPIMK